MLVVRWRLKVTAFDISTTVFFINTKDTSDGFMKKVLGVEIVFTCKRMKNCC